MPISTVMLFLGPSRSPISDLHVSYSFSFLFCFSNVVYKFVASLFFNLHVVYIYMFQLKYHLVFQAKNPVNCYLQCLFNDLPVIYTFEISICTREFSAFKWWKFSVL